MSNMDLWNAVQESDPAFVKEVSYGARKFSSIDAYAQIKAATAQFGPYGVLWGFKDDLTLTQVDTLMVGQGVFSHPDGHFTVTSSIEITSAKGRIDPEFAKKLETDMLTKGLSRLGFNADVFLGLFDDNRYVQSLRDKAAMPSSEAQGTITAMLKAVSNEDDLLAKEIWNELTSEEKEAVWPHFESHQRSAIKLLLKGEA